MPENLMWMVSTIIFGALAGGLTNTIAIWMLFHPYQPPKLFGRWTVRFLQGAVPKNQPRLAAAIGKTVGSRLLTPEDLTNTFADESFRRAFDDRLADFVEKMLQTDRGSIREMLPDAVSDDVDDLVRESVGRGMDRLFEYLDTEEFSEMMARRAGEFVEAIADEPIGDVLTSARGDAVEGAVTEWLQNVVESEDFSGAVEDYLDRGARRLLTPGRTFEQVLPLGLVGSVEKAIAGYLPLAAERLGGLLEDDSARARFESMLSDLMHRFLRDLKFHQRVVARLVVKEDTVDKVLDTIEAEGAERLSEILRDPEVQRAMARGVNQAIVDFLRRPVTDVLGEPDDQSVIESRGTLTNWVVGMARDPASKDFVIEKLHTGLNKAGDRTWGDVLERVPTEKVAAVLVSMARTDKVREALHDTAQGWAHGLLDRPIGRPSRWLPEDGPARLERALSEPIWDWLQTQVPAVVEKIDVAHRVEEKVLHFPMPRLEEIVRNVTDRELRLIVHLGYALGAFIGVIMVLMDAVWR